MKKIIIFLIYINFYFVLFCQSEHPDLGLNGVITWIDSTHIKVVYDWSTAAQLQDWSLTSGASLVRESGSVTITDGYTSVRAMIWKQGIKCSRIVAENTSALTSAGHLNFYTNVTSFNGSTYLPDPGLGAILASYKNFWEHDGVNAGNIGAPYLTVGQARNFEYTASTAGMTIKSSIDNVVYSYNASCNPALDRKVVLGGYGGNTKWGKVTIEGQITLPSQLEPIPPDVINFQSNGAVFEPVIEVTGSPVIEWIFDDSTTSSSATPKKNYGTAGPRRNYLRVTPWSALVGINVGYDAADGGYGGFNMVASQNILKFDNLSLAKNSLRYICANYNLMTELDLSEMTALEFIELYRCESLATLKLGSHPVLERLCAEDCDVYSLDISGCPKLEDFRAALNNYTTIDWGTTGQYLWHICIRQNPQLTQNLPPLTQFPALTELLSGNTNQSGAFVCNSSIIKVINSYDNHYTSADVSACTNLTSLSLSGSKLESLNLGTAGKLNYVRLKDCGFTRPRTDYVLKTLDQAGKYNGYLEIGGDNEPPSMEGIIHYSNLRKRGWIIMLDGLTDDGEVIEEQEELKISVTQFEIRLQLSDKYISWKADLFNIMGQRVITTNVESDILVLDVSSLPRGIYFVKLYDGMVVKTMKIFKP